MSMSGPSIGRDGSWPLTYQECRAAFRAASERAGDRYSAHSVVDGEDLTIDITAVGAVRPRCALLVMSGTHGIEGFAGSVFQTDWLHRVADWRPLLGSEGAAVFVHAVNPWGMANWRRANESNVDLNRNWRDDLWESDPSLPPNDAYGEVHGLLCPGGERQPDPAVFLERLGRIVEERGPAWARAAISGGQFDHADGLYFGGHRLERSTAILADQVEQDLAGVEDILAVDLHTGHGRYGTSTILSRALLGSDDDRWIRAVFGDEIVETTVANPSATAAPKTGQLAPGLVRRLRPNVGRSVTLEIGTRSETRMIAAEHVEHWLHGRGWRGPRVVDDLSIGRDQRAGVWEHRICSIPDDPTWEAKALEHGRRVLQQATAAVFA